MSSSRRRREVRNELEETFRRYEPAEGAPPPPRVEEAPPLPVAEEAPAPRAERPAPRVIPTGIPGMDGVLGGGLPDVSLLLVVGAIGSGYTTFLDQVLHGRLSDGGKVAYYTVEMPSLDVEEEMGSYGWGLGRFLEEGRWVFVDVLTPDLQRLAELAPEGFNRLRVSLSGSLNPLKTDLLGKIREERWTVLPLSHLLHTYELREAMNLMLYWRAAVRAYGGVHFAVLPSGVHPETSVNALKNLADGVLEFQLREGPRDYEGVLSVRKLRGLRTARRVQFTVTEEGISVETAERIR